MGYYLLHRDPPTLCKGCLAAIVQAAARKFCAEHPELEGTIAYFTDVPARTIRIEQAGESQKFTFAELGFAETC
jgi:hypothetical protein